MTKKTNTSAFTPTQIEASQPETLGVLWGAQAIADFIGRPVRDAYYLLQQGHIDADKCGDLWVTTKSRLRRQFDGGEQVCPRADQPSEAA
jgi:hypothetical protein